MRNLSEKTCTKCGEIFPATAEYFYKFKKGKYGLRSECKKCLIRITLQYYRLHKEERKAYRKIYNEKNK